MRKSFFILMTGEMAKSIPIIWCLHDNLKKPRKKWFLTLICFTRKLFPGPISIKEKTLLIMNINRETESARLTKTSFCQISIISITNMKINIIFLKIENRKITKIRNRIKLSRKMTQQSCISQNTNGRMRIIVVIIITISFSSPLKSW